MGLLKDFKSFIARGNVLDMAVGVIIGGSFSSIVNSLVNDIINPFIGIFMKTGSLSSIKTVIKEAVFDAEGNLLNEPVAINWGIWFQTIIDFLITAFCIFLIVRIFTKAKEKLESKKLAEEKAAAEAAAKAAEEAKAAADAAAAAAAEKQAALDNAILQQAALLEDIKTLLKNK